MTKRLQKGIVLNSYWDFFKTELVIWHKKETALSGRFLFVYNLFAFSVYELLEPWKHQPSRDRTP